jgi:DnaJ-class molecular chaperone
MAIACNCMGGPNCCIYRRATQPYYPPFRWPMCWRCHGSGWAYPETRYSVNGCPPTKCPVCNGTGRVQEASADKPWAVPPGGYKVTSAVAKGRGDNGETTVMWDDSW